MICPERYVILAYGGHMKKRNKKIFITSFLTAFCVITASLLPGGIKASASGNSERETTFAVTDYIEKSELENEAYAICANANNNLYIGIDGGSIAEGSAITLGTLKGDWTQAFFIRHVQNGYYKIINPRTKMALTLKNGSEGNGTPIVQSAYTGANSQLFSIKWNSDGSVGLLSKKNSSKIMGIKGGNAVEGAGIDIGANDNTPTQKFKICRIMNAPSWSETSRDLLQDASNLQRNCIEIKNLNDPSLTQNQKSVMESWDYVETTGDIAAKTVDTEGYRRICGWMDSAVEGQYLPVYKFVMTPESDQTVIVRYPYAGTYKGQSMGAVVTFSDINYLGSVATTYDNKLLLVASNLYAGYWYLGVSDLKINIKFYYSGDFEGGQLKDGAVPIEDPDMYLTFNSLNGDANRNLTGKSTSPDNGLYAEGFTGEFIGYADDQDGSAIGYTNGTTLGSAGDSLDATVTNIRSIMLEIRAPYTGESNGNALTHVFIGQNEEVKGSSNQLEATWTDELGSETFVRNSVSLLLKGPDTVFVAGNLGIGMTWNSFSSAAIYSDIDNPVKTIISASNHEEDGSYTDIAVNDEGKSCRVNAGGKVTFKIEQKISEMGVQTTKALSNLEICDTLPEGLVLAAGGVHVYAPDGYEITNDSSYGFLNIDGNTISYSFSEDYLKNNEIYTGENYYLTIEAFTDSNATNGSAYYNYAETFINDTNHEKAYSSNEVEVNIKNYIQSIVTKTVDKEKNERFEKHYWTADICVPVILNHENASIIIKDKFDERLDYRADNRVYLIDPENGNVIMELMENEDYTMLFSVEENELTLDLNQDAILKLAEYEGAILRFTYATAINEKAITEEKIYNSVDFIYDMGDGIERYSTNEDKPFVYTVDPESESSELEDSSSDTGKESDSTVESVPESSTTSDSSSGEESPESDESSNSVSLVQTGDTTNMRPWLIMLTGAVTALLISLLILKKLHR